MARKLNNWIQSFIDWTLPRSEAPASFHIWAALFTMSSVLKRRVCVPKTLLGGWEVYPHLFVIFVGPPGGPRKTTSANYSLDILDHMPNVTQSPHATSVEALYKKLSEAKDCAISIFSPEFAIFIKKSGIHMYDALTDLFDAKRSHSEETIGREYILSDKPSVNLLACTTPRWLADNLGEAAIGGGFSSRVIFVYEETVRRREIFYDDLDWSVINGVGVDLITDLLHIASLEGEFRFDTDAKIKFRAWYLETADKKVDERMMGYYERKPAHVLKLSMLLHLSTSDELVLNWGDCEAAIAILDEVEIKMKQTFSKMGQSQFAVEQLRIIEFVKLRGSKGVDRKEVLRAFVTSLPPHILNSTLDSLCESGQFIKFTTNFDDNYVTRYRFRDYSGS